MKTKAALLLLQLIAKRCMTEGEYDAFKRRITYMRWQQIRQNWPEIWQDFSERFEAVRDYFTRSADPELILDKAYPEGIQSYLDIFEYIPLQDHVSGDFHMPSIGEPASQIVGAEEEFMDPSESGSCIGSILRLLGSLLVEDG